MYAVPIHSKSLMCLQTQNCERQLAISPVNDSIQVLQLGDIEIKPLSTYHQISFLNTNQMIS